jgi:hypothetical protein
MFYRKVSGCKYYAYATSRAFAPSSVQWCCVFVFVALEAIRTCGHLQSTFCTAFLLKTEILSMRHHGLFQGQL